MRGTQSESNLHTPTGVPTSKAPSRSYRACTWCRAHKRKCDGLEPCTTCSNSPDGRKCEYAPPQKRGRKIKRQYDDKLSIEHVIKRRQDDMASYPEVLPVFENNKPLSASIAPMRIPENRSVEGPTLKLRNSPTPIELPIPIPTSQRYPDSLTSPQRYNYSSKYNSFSSPEISRVSSQESIPLRLPQIWPSSDDNFSRQSSFTVLRSPRQPTNYDSSSTASLSGSRSEYNSNIGSINHSTSIDSDFIATATNRGGSHSHPLMLSTRRYSLQQNHYTPIRDSEMNSDSGPDDLTPPGNGGPDK